SFIGVLSLALLMFALPDKVETWSDINLIFGISAETVFITHLFIISISLGAVGGFFRPAIAAAIPDLVPKDKLETANSLNLGTMQITSMIGNFAAGTLFVLVSAPIIFLVDALTYLFSAISELFIDIPQPKAKEHAAGKSGWQKLVDDTKDGLRYVGEKSGMREFVFMASLINFFSAPLMMLLPFYVQDHLKQTEAWYGYMFVIAGAGALIGFVVAGVFKPKGHKRIASMTFAFIFMAICIILSGQTQNLIVACIGMFLIGACVAYFNVLTMTVIQKQTTSEMRGRVVGLLTTLVSVVAPLGMGVSGFVFEWLDKSIPIVYTSTGVIFLLLSSYIFISSSYRNFFVSDEIAETQKEEEEEKPL
ncbi:MAG: MFS transporter, partial [Methylococcales bacterium]|nr:MFS transporter [Methylococcales bacterium]